jgi:hypothetical protein
VSRQGDAIGSLPVTVLYRAMIQDSDNRPEVGPSARKLGVRPFLDIAPDEDYFVDPDTGGMSVSPDTPAHLPDHRRPRTHGGTGDDPLWAIHDHQLVEGLEYRPDGNRVDHGFIEPKYRMRFDEYEDLLASTRDDWRLIP